MSKTAMQIIDHEIRASVGPREAAFAADRAEAARLLARAEAGEKLLARQLRCNAAGAHEFETVDDSGMFGGRFEEKCKHCGWIHTC